MKGLLPEVKEEELREADQELVRHRRQARSEGVYPDAGLLAVSAWAQMWSGKCLSSGVQGLCGVDVTFLSGSVINASLWNLSQLWLDVRVLR